MIESIIVYLGLMVIMMAFAGLAARSERFRWLYVTICCLCFGVVMGIRMNVGVDFPMYYKGYQLVQLESTHQLFEHWEPAFRYLLLICGSQFIHYSIPFGIIAFLQVFLVFYGLRKFPNIWVYIPLTLFLAGYFIPYNNIMRHMVAFSVFVCAIPWLAERKYWQYIGIILIAACFHKSAFVLMLIPPVYIWCKQIFTRVWVQLAWIGFGLIMMNIDYVQNIFQLLSVGMTMLGYGFYTHTSFAEFNEETKLGIGFLAMLCANLIIVWYSRRMKEYYESRTVNIMYDLFFLGVIIHLAFLRMFLLQRLNYYFICFEFIIAAFMLNFFVKKKNWLAFGSLILLYLALFYAKLNVKDDGSVLYHTFFE